MADNRNKFLFLLFVLWAVKNCYILFLGLFLEADTKEIGTKEIGMLEIDQGADARKGV